MQEELIQNCTVCETRGLPIWKQLSEVSLLNCPNCTHKFSKIHDSVVEEEYSQEYYDDQHKNWFDNPNLKLFEFVLKQIKQQGNDVSVLDVGCGDGAFLKYLKRECPTLKLSGIDFHENENIAGVEFHTGDISTKDFESKFDVVVNLAVIEHLFDVKTFTNKLKSLVKKDGFLITMTVNSESLIYRLSIIANWIGLSLVIERLFEKHHLNHFTKNSLVVLLENSGLSTDSSYFHPPMFAAVDLSDKINPVFVKIVSLALIVLIGLERLTGYTTLQTVVSKND